MSCRGCEEIDWLIERVSKLEKILQVDERETYAPDVIEELQAFMRVKQGEHDE